MVCSCDGEKKVMVSLVGLAVLAGSTGWSLGGDEKVVVAGGTGWLPPLLMLMAFWIKAVMIAESVKLASGHVGTASFGVGGPYRIKEGSDSR